MKIAIVWIGTPRLVDMTVRLDLYQAGFQALGFDCQVVCRRGAEDGFGGDVRAFDKFEDLQHADFWKSLDADAALVITWNGMVQYLQAAREAGQKIIAIADMDGQASTRVHFGEKLARELAETDGGVIDKLKVRLSLLRSYLGTWRKEEWHPVESTDLSARVLFVTKGARDCFADFLRVHGREDLIPRLGVAPYPVNDVFLDSPIPESKRRRAVAIGRWDSPQKNAVLLANAVNKYYERGGDWEIVTVGAGGEGAFGGLVRKYPKFRYAGRMGAEAIAGLLIESRVLLCSSRWESGPVVAFEALSSGCTIVTTPLPTIITMIELTKAGAISKSHRVADFRTAMLQEFEAWDSGERSPDRIASYWREQLQPEAICKACLAGMEMPQAARGVAGKLASK